MVVVAAGAAHGGHRDSTLATRDQAVEAKEKEEHDKFERRVCIANLTAADFDELIGANYRSLRPTKLDFSLENFKLENLDGLVQKDIKPNLSKLSYLDVSDNRLNFIDLISMDNGFTGLTTLIARRNLLISPKFKLNKLIELNLAHNTLVRPPSLVDLPALQILILSYNRLSGTFELLRTGERLKHIDLAHNRYNMTPSELSTALDVLKNLKGLQILRLYDNPFVEFFKEYQVFVVRKLKNLQKLDDLRITPALREDVADASNELKVLEVYDTAHRARMRAKAEKAGFHAGEEQEGATEWPKLGTIITSLEEILDDSSLLMRNIAIVMDHAERRARPPKPGQASSRGAEIFWDKIVDPDPDGKFEAVVSRVVELVLGTMERHETVRGELLSTLAYLTCEVRYGLGEKCMATLSRMMVSSQGSRVEVADVLQKIVIPRLKERGNADSTMRGTKEVETLVNGLNMMLQSEEVKEFIADRMVELLPMLAHWFITVQQLTEGPHFVTLLMYLTDREENAKMVASEEMAQTCIASIENKSIAESENLRPLYTALLKLSQNIADYGPEHIMTAFRTKRMHVELIGRVKRMMAERGSQKGRAMAVKARVVVGSLTFVTSMMRREDVLRSCCDSFLIHDMLVGFVTSQEGQRALDPMILAATCRCLHKILANQEMFDKHGLRIVEDLGKVAPLLQYLEGKKYPDLCKQAFRHMLTEKNADDDEEEDLDPRKFALENMQDAVVRDAFLAIIDFIIFFSPEPGKPPDTIREMVGVQMNDQKREEKLLRLMVVPNDDVRLKVVNCIMTVDPGHLDNKEMGMIIKCLSDTKNLGAGKTEEVLAQVVKLLQSLVLDKGKTGKIFCKAYAPNAIIEVYDIFQRNAQRETLDKQDEEEQKLDLSIAIVDFLRTCSCNVSLRSILRSPEIAEHFPDVLKKEETLHSPFVRDVAIERTWIGRSADNVLRCVKGVIPLDSSKKVLIRVLSRMADVIQGRTDVPIGTASLSEVRLADIARSEAQMWEERHIERVRSFLDDSEYEDREKQANSFITSDGLRLCRDNLATLCIDRNDEVKSCFDDAAEKLFAATKKGREKDMELQMEEKEQKAKEEVEEMELLEQDTESIRGRDALMKAIMENEDSIADDNCSLFTNRPDDYESEEAIFLDERRGTTNSAYPVAAYLRIVHALIAVPPSEICRQEAIREMRKPHVIASLLSLVMPGDRPACLSCNVAAKFLRLLSLALDTNSERSDTRVKLELYSVISKYVTRIAESMLFLLKLSKDSRLDIREQVLCLELCRFMNTLMSAVPGLIGQDMQISHAEVHHMMVTECVVWLVPEACVRLFIGVILYDIQMDVGGGMRGSIHDWFVRNAYQKPGMREQATAALVELLILCEDHRYDVLEVINYAEVFLHQTVRPCYMTELLTSVSLGMYRHHSESFLRGQPFEPSSLAHRVIYFEQVQVAFPAQPEPAFRLLCVTTERIYFLLPDPQTPPYFDNESKSGVLWDPRWEEAHPRNPTVDFAVEFEDIEKLYRGYGPQVTAMVYKRSAAQLSAAKTKGGAAGERAVMMLVFQRSGVRDSCLDFLRRLASRSREVMVLNDPTLREEVQKEAGEGVLILAATTAQTVPSRTQLGKLPTMLYVLTAKEVISFNMSSLGTWTEPPDDFSCMFDDGDDFLPDFGSAAQDGDGTDMQMGTHIQAGVLTVATPRRYGKRQKPAAPEKDGALALGNGTKPAVTDKKPTVLKKSDKFDLSKTSEVTFETSATADLTLKFGNKPCQIRFYDDSGREHWRRALAYALSMGAQKWERSA